MDTIPNTPNAYRLWWAETYPDVPYGYCICGCSNQTVTAPRTDSQAGIVKGEPKRCIQGHRRPADGAHLSAEQYQTRWQEETSVPYGFCWCGCGEQTPLSARTRRGNVAGEPVRYAQSGHVKRHQRNIENAKLPDPNPSGLCLCGCGQTTAIADQTHAEWGWVNGRHKRFVYGHGNKPDNYSAKTEILRRYADGESSGDLARELGISHNGVNQYVRRAGMAVRPHPHHRFTDDDRDRMCRLYESGLTTLQIKERYGVATGYVSHLLAKRGILAHGKISEEDQQALVREYEDGGNLTTIASRYGISRETVRSHVSAKNIRIRQTGEAIRKYACDDGFFEAVDSEHKAYLLGFIGADGCVRHSRILTVQLAGKDVDHLKMIRDTLNATNPVKEFTTKDGHDKALLTVNSPQLVAGLEAHGVHSAKSLTHEWPHFLPDTLLPHYVRGYHDGDGCFHNNRGRMTSMLCGSKDFLLWYRYYLQTRLGFSANKICTDGAIYKLSYSGNRQIARFAHLLYDNATIYMPRKRDKVSHLL